MKYIFLFALGITIMAGIITFGLPMLLNHEFSSSKHEFPNGTAIPDEWLVCETDSQCFAGECCHPRFCVNALGKPDCTGIACTEECRGDTMDCGCGSCACVKGKCAVKWSQDDFCSGGG